MLSKNDASPLSPGTVDPGTEQVSIPSEGLSAAKKNIADNPVAGATDRLWDNDQWVRYGGGSNPASGFSDYTLPEESIAESEEEGATIQLPDPEDWMGTGGGANPVPGFFAVPFITSNTTVGVKPDQLEITHLDSAAQEKNIAYKPEAEAAVLLSDDDEWMRQGGGASLAPDFSADMLINFLADAMKSPNEPVAIAARAKLDQWVKTPAIALEIVDKLFVTLCGKGTATGKERIFRLGNSLVCISVRSAMENSTQEQRINAAVERIQDAVADLPNTAEQREAEVKALVSTVPQTDSYPEQIQGFSEMTHALRVQMARQLEPKFREHLQDQSPRPDQRLEKDRFQLNRDLAERKGSFADKCTDDLFRLGLAIGWKGSAKPCHLGAASTKSNPRGRYLIIQTGGPGHIDETAEWNSSRKNEIPAENVTLNDAAPPDGVCYLSPRKKR